MKSVQAGGPAASMQQITVELVQQAGFRFEARFDKAAMPPPVTDEPPPIGGG